jgi:hypothetical protein
MDFMLEQLQCDDAATAEAILAILGKFFVDFPLEDDESEFADDVLELLENWLQTEEMLDMTGLMDAGTMAMTRFLIANLEILDEARALATWIDTFSITDVPPDVDIVYQFLADLLEQGKGELLGRGWIGWVFERVSLAVVNRQIAADTLRRIAVFLAEYREGHGVTDRFEDVIAVEQKPDLVEIMRRIMALDLDHMAGNPGQRSPVCEWERRLLDEF